MVASAKYMFGEIGTTLISATLETRATHVTEYMAYFLDSIRNTEQQITLIDFLPLIHCKKVLLQNQKLILGIGYAIFFSKHLLMSSLLIVKV